MGFSSNIATRHLFKTNLDNLIDTIYTILGNAWEISIRGIRNAMFRTCNSKKHNLPNIVFGLYFTLEPHKTRVIFPNNFIVQ